MSRTVAILVVLDRVCDPDKDSKTAMSDQSESLLLWIGSVTLRRQKTPLPTRVRILVVMDRVCDFRSLHLFFRCRWVRILVVMDRVCDESSAHAL